MTHEERVNSNRILDEYFDSLLIRYRYVDNVMPDLHTRLFGEVFETPIFAGAFGKHAQIHDSGCVGYAKGAEAAGSFAMFGWVGDEEIERTVQAGCRAVRGLKPFADEDLIYRILEHDERHGAFAVCMNICHGFDRYGEYSQGPFAAQCPKTRAELERYVKATRLPFLVKGVLSVQDAVKCAESGVSAIVLSSHNNRFQGAVPPLAVLPEIRRELGSSMPILVDGGIVSGVEAFKALALGADGVFSVKALLAGFRKGPEVVTEKLREMTAELKGCMANTGASAVTEISEEMLFRKNW